MCYAQKSEIVDIVLDLFNALQEIRKLRPGVQSQLGIPNRPSIE